MSLEKKVEFVRLAYLGTMGFIQNGSESFELKDKAIGEFRLIRRPDNKASVWFMRNDGGCCGRHEIGSDADKSARQWLCSVINSIGYPKAQELRDAVENELGADPDDFCLTMSD